jgi:diguanylate cyclase (GGDEF)-like protein
MRPSPSRRSTARSVLVAVVAMAAASAALTVVATGVLDARSHGRQARRLADLATLAHLAGHEEHLLAAGRPDGANTLQLRRVVARLVQSSPGDLNSIVVPTVDALGLADHKRPVAAARAFARVQRAAQTQVEAQAMVGDGGLTRLAQVEKAGAVIAAAICSLFGLAALVRLRRDEPAAVIDAHVEQLAAEARTDSLTGLGNQRSFNEALSAAIAARAATNTPFVLLAIDLDSLKRINDTEGHPAGDAHLKRVADCLRAEVGTNGTVHRTGGDEFMAVLPGSRSWQGLGIARAVDEATRKRVGRRAVSMGLTESTGTESRQLLVAQADLALYEAKRTKLNAVVFNPGLAKVAPSAAADPRQGPGLEQRALAAALARAVDAKDVGTQSHCETVAQLSVAIGERIGIAGNELERLRIAGLLHDVGKIGVADAILQKPDVLDDDEREAMTRHVEIGHSILLAAELSKEAEWVLYHHERYDGRGYPARRRAAEIPLESRIIAVADAFEAMTADRPYRAKVSAAEAIAELQAAAGTQFDGRCVDALVDAIAEVGEEQTSLVPDPETAPAPSRRLRSTLVTRAA